MYVRVGTMVQFFTSSAMEQGRDFSEGPAAAVVTGYSSPDTVRLKVFAAGREPFDVGGVAFSDPHLQPRPRRCWRHIQH